MKELQDGRVLYGYIGELPGYRNLNFDAGFQADGGDLLDNLAGGVQVDQPLVDFELVAIPCLRTLTTRGFTGGNLEDFSREANGTFNTKIFVLCAIDEFAGELLQIPDVTARQGDADFVNFWSRFSSGSVVFLFALSDVTHSAVG